MLALLAGTIWGMLVGGVLGTSWALHNVNMQGVAQFGPAVFLQPIAWGFQGAAFGVLGGTIAGLLAWAGGDRLR